MKISAYQSVGGWSVSVDIEYNSENVHDCIQADKFVSRILEESDPENGRCCETGINREASQE